MKSIHRVWLAAALLSVIANCSVTQKGEPELPTRTALLTAREEAQLGEQLYEQLSTAGIKWCKDPIVNAYLAGVLARLGGDAHLHVIDDLKTASAWSTPGEHVYLTTGLLLNVDDESELAGVLGHELGHLASHHGSRQLVSELGQQTLIRVALGSDPRLLGQLATSLASNQNLLVHSRADEREADVWALRYAAFAGYDPRGIALFFRKLPTRARDPYTWLQQHPAAADRIENVNQVIARESLAGPRLGRDALRPIQAHLEGERPVSWR